MHRATSLTAPALALAGALLVGGCASGGQPEVNDVSTTAGAESGSTSDSLTFVGTDDVTWEASMKSTADGSTELTITCGEAVNHGLGIEGVQDGAELVACEAGGTDTTTIELEAGDYTFFCTVPGHRDAGMEGRLAVG